MTKSLKVLHTAEFFTNFLQYKNTNIANIIWLCYMGISRRELGSRKNIHIRHHNDE